MPASPRGHWLVSLVVFLALAVGLDGAALVFTAAQYHAFIGENSAGKQYVRSNERMGVKLSTINSSWSQQIDLRYRISRGNHGGYFKPECRCLGDFCFLLIRTRTNHPDVLNRERQKVFRLHVKAVNRAVKGRSKQLGFTEVVVHVEDRNDLSPWFDSADLTVDAPEDLPLHAVVAKVHALDADQGFNAEIFYSLLEYNNHFYMHPTSGELILLRRLNHRRQAGFQLTAIARNRRLSQSGSEGRQRLNIKVRPVNLHDPVMLVNHVTEVVEHSYINVYAIVHVSDKDDGANGEVQSVEISDGDQDRLFKIVRGSNSHEYLVGLIGNLDREHAPYGYNLTLKAMDNGVPTRSSFKSIKVRLMDVNDHAPSFTRKMYVAHVKETALPNTRLLQLRASDTDWGVNAELRYFITAGNEHQMFQLNPLTGLLSTRDKLDAETKSLYSLTVSALDHGYGSNRRQGSAKVTINVIDQNDNAPTLPLSRIEVYVDENEPSGLLVTRLKAQDVDQGDNSFLSYTIMNDEHLPFAINHFDGSITTTEVLDYETQARRYSIRVQVSDWGKPYRRQIEALVTVNVRNVNDNRPQFERVDCRGYIARRIALGTHILSVSAIDADEGSVLRYRIVSGNTDGCFSLDAQLGILLANCDLTKAKWKKRRLSVMANDGEHFSLKSHVDLVLVGRNKINAGRTVKLRCRDTGASDKHQHMLATWKQRNSNAMQSNDELSDGVIPNKHVPEILNEFTNFTIEEGVEIGTYLTTVKARDKDMGFEGLLVFALSSGDEDSVFTLDMDRGIINITGHLDRERTAQYSLNITVCDLGSPQFCSSIMFFVQVKDINDNAPKFLKTSLVFHFLETRQPQSVVKLEATDIDEGLNGQVRYILLTSTDDFSVDTNSGLLTQIGSLDHERQVKYELVIVARDSSPTAPLESHVHVHVDVLDVNDNAPVFSQATYWARVLEDVPVGSVVLSVDAHDPDRLSAEEPVEYSLVQGSHGHFGVDSFTGAVRLLRTLDFERRQVFNLTVEARDRANSPSALSSRSNVLVLVIDVNENLHRPTFSYPLLSAFVAENQPPGTVVARVHAVDRDPPGVDSEVHYSIRGGDGVGYFTINQSGVIVTSRMFDRETAAGYWLTVIATDTATVPLSSQLEVYVSIMDVNDNAPLSSQTVYECEVMENSRAGTAVVRITAEDADSSSSSSSSSVATRQGSIAAARRGVGLQEQNDRQEISYSITGGDPDMLFHIDSISGKITTTGQPLNRETHDSHMLEVTLSDNGDPRLTSLTWVKVNVVDVNEFAPVFLDRFYRLEVPAALLESSDSVVIAQLVAYDEDDGLNSSVRYSLVSSTLLATTTTHATTHATTDATTYATTDAVITDTTNVFSVDEMRGFISISPRSISSSGHSGVVVVDDGPLVRPGNQHELTIVAEDGGSPPLSSQARVVVHVQAVAVSEADRPISLHLPSAPVLVMNTDPVGHLVAVIGTNSSTALFNIVGGNEYDLFSVDSGGGVSGGVVIVVTRSLIHHGQTRFHLNITATTAHHTVCSTLQVHVMGVTSRRPLFSAPLFVANVSELSTKAGSVVTTLTIQESTSSRSIRDTPSKTVHHLLEYSIVGAASKNSLELFTVDMTSGHVMLTRSLDRETANQHIISVSVCVTDTLSRGALCDYARVFVRVQDSNDHAPRFTDHMITTRVLNTAAVGSHVTSVLAYDLDHGFNAQLTYSILSGNVDATFALHERTGDLTVASPLSSSLVSEFLLTVRVSDAGSPSRHSDLHVNIVISMPNNAVPQFDQSEYVAEIAEDLVVGSVVLRVSAQCQSAVTYRIMESSSSIVTHLALNPGSGVLTVSSALDYETVRIYNFTIRAISTAGVSAVSRVIVHVLDVNDHAPQFLLESYSGWAAETAAIGSPVMTSSAGVTSRTNQLLVSAVDADTGANGQLVYSVLETSAAKLVRVDPATGAVSVAGRLDYETTPHLWLTVSVTDRGRERSLRCWRPVKVHVRIINVDDEAPQCPEQEQQWSLWMPSFSGVHVATISATDPDSHELTYKMAAYHDLSLQTTNDVTSDVITEAAFLMDMSSGSVCVGNTTSVDGLPVVSNWAVTVSDGHHSAICAVKIRKHTAQEFSASSSGNLSPANGRVLSFSTDIFYAAVSENRSSGRQTVVVLTVKGAKPNVPLRFTELTNSSYFRVDGTSGVVYTSNVPLDRELHQYHVLVVQVRATWQSRGSHVARAQVNISVTDVNDNAPLFVGRPYHAVLPRDMPPGTVVSKVLAVDSDAGQNGRVTYSLLSTQRIRDRARENTRDTSEHTLFSVDRDRGEITWQPSSSWLSHKSTYKSDQMEESFALLIEARDQGDSSLMSRARVTVSLVSNQLPLFHQAYYQARVKENTLVDTPIMTISAIPSSLSSSSSSSLSNHRSAVVYLLVGRSEPHNNSHGRSKIPFRIDFYSGVVYVSERLDYEQQREYQLTAVAIDRQAGSLTSSVPVTVQVTNVNDLRPQLTSRLELWVSEAASLGTRVGRINATDSDIDLPSSLSYRITEADGVTQSRDFSCDEQDGVIKVIDRLDREVTPVHRLRVFVQDDALPALHSSLLLIIHVNDTNDNSPVFDRVTYEGHVTERPVSGQLVMAVKATDADLANNLQYRIADGDEKQHFHIDSSTGVITVASVRDFSSDAASISDSSDDVGVDSAITPVFHLNVSASDRVHVAYVHVRVAILPTNQHVPEFSRLVYTADLAEDSEVGTRVTQVSATDLDPGHLGHVTYHISSPRWAHVFAVNETSGVISTHAAVRRVDGSVPAAVQLSVAGCDAGGLCSYCVVHAAVRDVNDHSPVFAARQYRVSLGHNSTAGRVVLKVEAEDVDTAENGRVFYSILESNSSDIRHLFDIDPHSGEIILMAHADKLESPVYQFFVRATDNGAPRRNADVPVDILVMPAGIGNIAFEQKSLFSDARGTVYLPEDLPVGTVVATVAASTGDNVKVEYSLLDEQKRAWQSRGDDSPAFVIGQTGDVILAASLDRESRDSYTILVSVIASGGLPPLVAIERVLVRVVDCNDNRPQFEEAAYWSQVVENQPAGTKVMQVTADDFDAGVNGQVRYSLVLPSSGQLSNQLTTCDQPSFDDVNDDDVILFSVDEQSGWISTRLSLDAERCRVHSVTVQASDGAWPRPLTSTTVVHIKVIDLNDCAPSFTQQRYVTAVLETAMPGTQILSLHVEDRDLEVNKDLSAPLTFHVTSGDPRGHFRVYAADSGVAELVVMHSLDRELQPDYSLTISATDGVHIANTTVQVDVLDVNDNAPECMVPLYHLSVAENASVPSFLFKMAASDADTAVNAQLKFTLSGDGSHYFHVHPSLGDVTLVSGLDRENMSEYLLTISAWNVVPPATSLIKHTSNQPHHAEDADYFSAGGAPGDNARDFSAWRCFSQLKVTVTDINDCAPQLAHDSREWRVPEDVDPGYVIGQLKASDNDTGESGQVEFMLGENSENLITLDGQNGIIYLTSSLDRETRDRHNISVIVRDRGAPALSSRDFIIIHVLDINDNAPVFSEFLYELNVTENSTSQSRLLHVQATSRDTGVNALISYRIVGGNEGDVFSLHPHSGWLGVSSGVVLDAETARWHLLEVEARDGGSPPLSAISSINITVQDINDNPPRFTRPKYHRTIAENITVGSEIVQLLALDADSGMNGQVSYLLTRGDPQHQFSVNSSTGVVTVSKPLDREMVGSYLLHVVAMDAGNPPLSCSVNLTVQLQDVNDNTPVFSHANYSAVVQEGREAGVELVKLSVSDSDLPPHAEPFIFRITSVSPVLSPSSSSSSHTLSSITNSGESCGHPCLFTVDSSGVLRTAAILNLTSSADQLTYIVSVSVSDSGGSQDCLSSTTLVTVSVVERSRYAPVPEPLSVTVVSVESQWSASRLGRFTATDLDPHDSMSFSLSPPDGTSIDHTLFSVDANSGDISATTELDPGLYQLNLSVSDGTFHVAHTVHVRVIEVDEHVLDTCAVIVSLSGVWPRQFVSSSASSLLRQFRALLARSLLGRLIDAEQVEILGVQRRGALGEEENTDPLSLLHSASANDTNKINQLKHEESAITDILVAVRSQLKDGWLHGSILRREFGRLEGSIVATHPDVLIIGVDVDTSTTSCSSSLSSSNNHTDANNTDMIKCQHGKCGYTVQMALRSSIVNSDRLSFVAPVFSRVATCHCHQGYSGATCSRPLNPCVLRPCAQFQLCHPSPPDIAAASGGVAYSCRCPAGHSGPLCVLPSIVNVANYSHSHTSPSMSGIHAVRYSGATYMLYQLASDMASGRRFSAGLHVRTRSSSATLLYMAGTTEYSVLEIVGGVVRYRFDCGTGEGRVMVPVVRVDDNRWHSVRVERFGKRAEVLIDGQFGAQGSSAGHYEFVSIASGLLLVGAALPSTLSAASSSAVVDSSTFTVQNGLHGCLEAVQVFHTLLPLSARHDTPSVRLVRSNGAPQACSLLDGGVVAAAASDPANCDCINGGVCVSVVDGSCRCPPRFTGRRCQYDTDPCASSPCLHSGNCSAVLLSPHSDGNQAAGFQCACQTGLTGSQCQYGRFCSPNPCHHGASCEEGDSGALCHCRGFSGRLCAVDVDECRRALDHRRPLCRNNASCVNTVGGFRCVCRGNWTGPFCSHVRHGHVTTSHVAAAITWHVPLVAAVLFLLLLLVLSVAVTCWKCRTKRGDHVRSRTPRRRRRVKLTAGGGSGGHDASSEVLLQAFKNGTHSATMSPAPAVHQQHASSLADVPLKALTQRSSSPQHVKLIRVNIPSPPPGFISAERHEFGADDEHCVSGELSVCNGADTLVLACRHESLPEQNKTHDCTGPIDNRKQVVLCKPTASVAPSIIQSPSIPYMDVDSVAASFANNSICRRYSRVSDGGSDSQYCERNVTENGHVDVTSPAASTNHKSTCRRVTFSSLPSRHSPEPSGTNTSCDVTGDVNNARAQQCDAPLETSHNSEAARIQTTCL